MNTYGLVSRALGLLRREGVVRSFRSAAAFLNHQTWKQRKTRLQPALNRAKQYRAYGGAAPERYRLIRIDPHDIEYILANHFWERLSKFTTHIVGGQWDRNRTHRRVMLHGPKEGIEEQTLYRVDNYQLYDSAIDHFDNGTPWEETELYRWLIAEWLETDSNIYMNRYASESEIRSRLAELDDLYEHMRDHGYLTQEDIQGRRDTPLQSPRLAPEHHEVAVDIGRDGEIILDDGRHRFIVARALGLERIPVRVLVRHKRWQALRAEVHDATTVSELSSKAKTHLDHPDMRAVLPESIRTDREPT